MRCAKGSGVDVGERARERDGFIDVMIDQTS